MKKTAKLFSYILLVIGMVVTSCQSNETRKQVKAATPSDPVIINKTTTTRLDVLDEGTRSGMRSGFSWLKADGVFITETPDLSADDPTAVLSEETKVGGMSRSDGYVREDTIPCGQDFIDVQFTAAGEPTTTDITNADSIGAKTVQIYTGNDGQELTTEDIYKYLIVNATLATPHYEPTSSITGVRYEYDPLINPDSRVVWIKIAVTHKVEGTLQGISSVREIEIGYVQTKTPAVTPVDPLRIKMNILEMFRTYRKRDQHSIMDLWMSFNVINAKTGEIVDEIDTDSRMAAKIGHFGAPSNGYSLEEKRLIGTAPTSVEEELDANNEEAKNASKTIGKFNFKVDAYKQRYFVHFPVMGRDDSEGGKEAGGERLLFQLNGSYVDPAMDYTFNFQITHRTEVVVKGWEQRTPDYQRPADPGITYTYLSSYVVEFIDHMYLNGEEIVWVDSDEGTFYYLIPNGTPAIEVNNPDYNLYYTGSDYHPFHTSNMIVDGWKPSFE